jgi:N-acyl homoserine lactone hydrolase
VELEGEAEIVAGVRVLPTPGHTPGHQAVLVDTEDGLVVVASDVTYRWEEFDAAAGPLLGLGARRIWLAHETEPRDA